MAGTSFPVIDVSGIERADLKLQIAQKITEASKEWGFLLFKGYEHYLPAADIAEMFRLTKEFFYLPEEKKDPWPLNEKLMGYKGTLKDGEMDDVMSMWFKGIPGALDGNHEALPLYWREHTGRVEKFKAQCHALMINVLECFAIALGLPDKSYFASAHAANAGNGNALRMMMYPARDKMIEGTSRMSPHTDTGSITLLFQNAPGLEVESPSGDWVKAPYLENHIVVNIGDALSLWSGAQLKATMHRVTLDGVPFDRERITMAYFGGADPNTALEPIKKGSIAIGAITKNGVTVYPGITVGEYDRLVRKKNLDDRLEQKREQTAATLPKGGHNIVVDTIDEVSVR